MVTAGAAAAAAAARERPNDDDTLSKHQDDDEDDGDADADTMVKQENEYFTAERSRSRAGLESLFSRLYPPELAEEDGMKISRSERLSKGYTSVTLTYGEVSATGVSRCFEDSREIEGRRETQSVQCPQFASLVFVSVCSSMIAAFCLSLEQNLLLTTQQ